MLCNRKSVLFLLAVLCLACAAAPQEDDYAARRHRMVETAIARPPFPVDPVEDPQVLEAMRAVPRHEFVPPPFRPQAYQDRPLPIGHNQTISQPYMVAKMTELLAVDADDRVFEVGTGSGYQAAVLAEIVQEVYTVEIVEPLAFSARLRLRRLGYDNVHVKAGDGYAGWPEQAPFDAVIVTAGATHIPPPLLEQLKPGGRMVIPVGTPPQRLTLQVVHRGATPDDYRVENVMPVAFVPLTGGHDEPKEQ